MKMARGFPGGPRLLEQLTDLNRVQDSCELELDLPGGTGSR